MATPIPQTLELVNAKQFTLLEAKGLENCIAVESISGPNRTCYYSATVINYLPTDEGLALRIETFDQNLVAMYAPGTWITAYHVDGVRMNVVSFNPTTPDEDKHDVDSTEMRRTP